MISDKLIKEAEKLMYSYAEEFESPAVFHINLSNRKGQEIADKVGADKKIVYLGTTLMDCMLGPAMKKGKRPEHIKMGEEATIELLSGFSEVTNKEKENILYCVREHHGVEKFYSLESEICCNADCYRFVSVEGVIGGINDFRKMPLENLVQLYLNKAEEKWNALSLDFCKKELEPQYKTIKTFLLAYKSSI